MTRDGTAVGTGSGSDLRDATTQVRDDRLDLVAKLYQGSLSGAVERVGHGHRLSAPLIVELDPTSFCDLACPECISTGLLNQGRFTQERLTSLADELVDAGVRGVILIGGGEPLLHPAIASVITTLADGGLQIGITTNGTQIGRHLDVVARCATWTRVSVDAATADLYAAFRPSRNGRNAFSAVIQNLRLLAEVKLGVLGFSFLLMSRRDAGGTIIESNFDEVYAAAVLAQQIGCDYFELKPEYDMGHYLIRQDKSLVNRLA